MAETSHGAGREMRRVAVVPAKANSRRVARKNLRPFWRGESLVSIKIRVLLQSGAVDHVVVSSDDSGALELARQLGAEAVARPITLCGDHVDLGELFGCVLAPYAADIVYWAHPTSPFVAPATIQRAVNIACERRGTCVLGVERLLEFLWDETRPLNYAPETQPRSQDLPPLWRVTGGIHVAQGGRFIEERALAFDPVYFLELSKLEALDIDTEEDWELCAKIADYALPRIMA